MKYNKWVWIRRECRRNGYDDLVEQAKRIQKTLRKIYGKTSTSAWKQARDIGLVKNSDGGRKKRFLDVVCSKAFCAGCVNQYYPYDCTGCEFGDVMGQCRDDNSAFGDFLRRAEKKKWLL